MPPRKPAQQPQRRPGQPSRQAKPAARQTKATRPGAAPKQAAPRPQARPARQAAGARPAKPAPPRRPAPAPAPPPPPEPLEQFSGGHLARDYTFNDWLQDAVHATPWWAISLAFHVVLILLLGVVTLFDSGGQKYNEVIMIPPPERLEELDFELEREVIEERNIDEDEPYEEDPLLVDYEESDHNETDNDEEFEQMKGESEDAVSDKPLQGPSWNDSIGAGGGCGGAFGGRLGGRRNLCKRGGGGKKTESAVLEGLRWLARHQHPDGHWSSSGFSANCKKGNECEGAGYEHFDIGVTGLSLLAFLGAGYTHTSTFSYEDRVNGKEINFGEVVKQGLRWLQQQQNSRGCFGPENAEKMGYNHSVAALAMAEAYGLTMSPLFNDPAQKGIDFLVWAQNRVRGAEGTAGDLRAWRYKPRDGENDTSVSGWCVMALKSAEISGLEVPRSSFEGVYEFYRDTTEEVYFKVGYTSREGAGRKVAVRGKNDEYHHHESLAAVGMMSRTFIKKNFKDPALTSGAKLLVADLPKWDKLDRDYYYWYYATLALYQVDGPDSPGSQRYWKSWNKAMINALVPHQHSRKDGCLHGAWTAESRWGFEGGMVYTTAVNVLTLEVYYRYGNAFGTAGRESGKKPK